MNNSNRLFRIPRVQYNNFQRPVCNLRISLIAILSDGRPASAKQTSLRPKIDETNTSKGYPNDPQMRNDLISASCQISARSCQTCNKESMIQYCRPKYWKIQDMVCIRECELTTTHTHKRRQIQI